MDTSEQSLSQDDVFELLSSPRRRYVLYHLREADEPVELTTLAEQVAAWENETSVEEITEQERKRVYGSLYQTHIQRLDESGVVSYDKDSGMVMLNPDADEIDTYLKTSADDRQWQWVYLVLAATSTLLLGLTVLEAPLFAAFSEAAVAALIIAAFVVTAVVHAYDRLRNKQSIPSELRE
jgi:hypothetical protein